ncbi:MAG TPA: rhodanese-like domain-containing protein [Dehalococcoidia bacterium]|jgi:rhodanese-related sulfurtransferase|nr:rhodanese-like domain-containing protein [Dehalococcoidia bacterium]
MTMKLKLPKLGRLALSGLLIALLVLGGGCLGQKQAAPGDQIIEDVTLEEAYALMMDNLGSEDFVILDVRTPEEYASGHIERAVNLDYYSETFKEELDKLDKDKVYLIYCRSGNRSGKALAIMEELGFREVYNMRGGMIRWEAVGMPVVK